VEGEMRLLRVQLLRKETLHWTSVGHRPLDDARRRQRSQDIEKIFLVFFEMLNIMRF